MAEEFDEDVEQDFDDFEEDENQEEVEFDDQEEEFEENSDFEDDQDDYEDSDSSDDEEDFDKPVSEGETVELDIEDLGSKGDGIARKEGFVIFVPGGEVGESYDVEITSVGRKFAFGEIAE